MEEAIGQGTGCEETGQIFNIVLEAHKCAEWWLRCLHKPRERKLCTHIPLFPYGLHCVHASNIPKFGNKTGILKQIFAEAYRAYLRLGTGQDNSEKSF